MSAITSCKRCGAPLGADEAQKPLQGMCTRCLFELGLEEGSHVVITGTGEAPAPPPTPEELQPLFPQFELIELLGQGGMGVVYRARQKGLGREVALKVLPAKAGRNPAFAERFAREAKALASLSHPNITSVYDFGKAGEHFFLVMELVDGVNLRQLVRAQRVAPKQALQIVEQICDALQYAHDEGVVHRDIKPENILLDRKGRLKITDFGLAKLLDRAGGPASPPSIGLTESHQVMGTPHYMAPEQIERPSSVDHRADIYSLGVVFYELLTGELPLGRFASPSGKVQVDVRLDAVVLRALEKEPELRYQSAGAVKTDVHDIAEPGSGERAVRAAPGAGPAPAPPPRKPARSLARVLGVLFIALVGVAVVAFGAALLLPLGGRSSAQKPGALTYRIDLPPESWPPGAEAEPFVYNTEPARTEPRASDPRLVRLVGVPLFETKSGMPGLSLPFRTVFATDEEVAGAISRALLQAREAYSTAEKAHTLREIPEPGAARITLEPFPEEARKAAEAVLREAHALLPSDAYEYLVARGALEAELFPTATDRIVHDLRLTPEGFAWSTSVGGGPAVLERGESLPSTLAKYWEELYRPLLPSVLSPLEHFLAEVRALDAQGETILISFVHVGLNWESLVAHVSIEASTTVKGTDLAASSRLLDELCDRLKAVPGFAVREVSTRSQEGGAWLSVPVRAEIELDLAQAPRHSSPASAEVPRPETALVPLINLRASAAGIALDRVVPNQAERENWEYVRVELEQAQTSARPLDQELAWLRTLEGLGKYAAVTEVTLKRTSAAPGSPEEGDPWGVWRARLQLFVQQQL